MALPLAPNPKLAITAAAPARCVINRDSFRLLELARLVAEPVGWSKLPARIVAVRDVLSARNRWRSEFPPESRQARDCAFRAKESLAHRVVHQGTYTL